MVRSSSEMSCRTPVERLWCPGSLSSSVHGGGSNDARFRTRDMDPMCTIILGRGSAWLDLCVFLTFHCAGRTLSHGCWRPVNCTAHRVGTDERSLHLLLSCAGRPLGYHLCLPELLMVRLLRICINDTWTLASSRVISREATNSSRKACVPVSLGL